MSWNNFLFLFHNNNYLDTCGISYSGVGDFRELLNFLIRVTKYFDIVLLFN